MKSIIELEIKNLSEKEKEELLKTFSYKYYSRNYQENATRGIRVNPDYKDFGTFEEFVGEEKLASMSEEELEEEQEEYEEYINDWRYKKYKVPKNIINKSHWWTNEPAEVLELYFEEYPDDFIDFQRTHKNSLYNQAIKQHGFKELTDEDVVRNLTPEQKNEVVNSISSWVEDLKDEYNRYYNGNITEVELHYIYPEDKKEIEAWQNLPEEEKWDYEWKSYYPDVWENADEYLKSDYVIAPKSRWDEPPYEELEFFRDDEEFILFGLGNQTIAPEILNKHKFLDKNYQVNQFIVENHKLKEKLNPHNQTNQFIVENQELDEPKLKK